VVVIIGFTTTYAISAYHHSNYEFESHSWQGGLGLSEFDRMEDGIANHHLG
jgi:hypothetical protein